MLSRPALAGAFVVLFAASAAAGETRTFVIANSPDGYGVDQCLAEGASCGRVIAAAYCRSQHFEDAVSFRRVEPAEDVLAAALVTPTGARAKGDAFVAIACSR